MVLKFLRQKKHLPISIHDASSPTCEFSSFTKPLFRTPTKGTTKENTIASHSFEFIFKCVPSVSSRTVNRFAVIIGYSSAWALLVRFYAIINNEEKRGIYQSIRFLLFADMFKIIISLILLTRRLGYREFVKLFRSTKNRRMFLFYIPVAIMYAMNNTGNQVSPQIDDIQYKMNDTSNKSVPSMMHLIQMICGVTAALSNERLLKQDNAKLLHLHNIYLYLNMMVIRIVMRALGFNKLDEDDEEIETFSALEYANSTAPVSIFGFLIVLTAVDIMNSMMLRYENTTTKVVISTVVLGVISFIHYVIYHFTFVPNKIFAIFLIRMGIVMICFPIEYFKRVAQSRQEVRWKSMSEMCKISLSSFRICMILLCSALFYIQLRERKFIRKSMLSRSINIIESIEGDSLSNLAPFYLDAIIDDDDDDSEENFGLIACISSQNDIAHSIALGRSMNEMNENKDTNITLELYHYASIGHFLTAELESYNGVSVIDLKAPLSDSCLVDAMSKTNLDDIMLVNTSVILFGDLQNRRKHQSVISKSLCDFTNATGTVTSTTLEMDKILDLFSVIHSNNDNTTSTSDFGSCKFRSAFHYEDNLLVNEHFDIVVAQSNGNETEKYPIGQTHFIGDDPSVSSSQNIVSGYIYPVREDFEWITYELQSSFFCESLESTISMCDEKLLAIIKSSWYDYRDAHNLLLLDRPLMWVTSDGGLFSHLETQKGGKGEICDWFDSLGENNFLNIDLTMASDSVNAEAHNSYDNEIIQKLQNQVVKGSRKLFGSCLPNNVVKKLLQGECDSNCTQYTDLAKDFMDALSLKKGVETIFNLRSTNSSSQEAQAWEIYDFIKEKSYTDESKLLGNVAVRLSPSSAFNASETTNGITTYNDVALGKMPHQLKYYFDAPSKLACYRMASWAQEHNVRLVGCFINQNYDIHIPNSSQPILKTDIATGDDLNLICDTQSKHQNDSHLKLLNEEIYECVENGFDMVYHSHHVPLQEYHSVISESILSSTPSEKIISESLSAVKSRLVTSVPSEENGSATIKSWDNPESTWGLTSPYSWSQRKQWNFSGSAGKLNTVQPDTNMNVEFNDISRILTIMLFLRLEELSLLGVSDEINGNPDKVTWFQVFSNTAGTDDSGTGKVFLYDDLFWSYVPQTIEATTEMSFIDAITFYILDPMGLVGTFNNTDVEEAPDFPANGFIGSNEDLLLIGSTLATGGVSPKTRKRVLMRSSVIKMLEDSTKKQNAAKTFPKDETVLSITKFQSYKYNHSPGITESYGMGLWRVNGWRRQHNQTSPVTGWLSVGRGDTETILYFDEMGFALAMSSAKEYFETMLAPSFADVIEEIGSQLETAIDVTKTD